jgi:signal recognition particle receptor subunit beta
MPVKIVVSGGFGLVKTAFIGSLSKIALLTMEASMSMTAVGIDSSLILDRCGIPGRERFGTGLLPVGFRPG